MTIQLIVFDLAGTTVKDNKDVHRVLQQALAEDRVAISLDEANAVMGIPKPIAIRQLLESRYQGERSITEEWIDEIHKRFVRNMVRFYEEDPGVGEKDGVSDTFAALRKHNIKVFVDTGFDRPVTAPLLKRLGWEERDLIDGSVTSDEVRNGRPYPDMIFEAMRQAGVHDAARVAKVGDTSSDLQEGNAAGCGLVIGVTSGAFSADQLRSEEHTHLIQDIPEILEILELK
ncbi:MAG: HAD hydrolase-like protein [Bacteroidia bacterium]|nr:HAD hydrolase-like protein [Bacteroidia bacterium]